MSISPTSRRQCIRIRSDQNVNEIKFRQKLDRQKQQQSTLFIKQRIRKKSSSPRNCQQGVYSKQITVKDQIQFYFQSAKETKINIKKGLQFVKLIDNFNQQQRCLQHNNVRITNCKPDQINSNFAVTQDSNLKSIRITALPAGDSDFNLIFFQVHLKFLIITLYCMNDHQLLCVYCIYGVHKHRAHKILPAFQNLQQLARDVIGLQQKYNQFLLGLDDVIRESKKTTQLFQNMMKKALTQNQIEYMKRKLQLQQNYDKQKKSVVKVYQDIIQKTHQISNQYEEIKFNIWEYQAKYNLDKRVKGPSFVPPGHKDQNAGQGKTALTNQRKSLKKQKSSIKRDQAKDEKQLKSPDECPNSTGSDTEKDFRQILSKHVVLSHIVQEMRSIQPIKINQKNLERRVMNRTNPKAVPTKDRSNSRTVSRDTCGAFNFK